MSSDIANESELLEKASHRGLWFALILLLALGAYAVIINIFPASDAASLAGRAAGLLPIAIIVALAAMRSSLKGASTNPNSKAMKALLNDELRQQSLARAYRNALIATLLAQPLLAWLLNLAPLPQPVVLMASLSVLVGVATVLGSMLAYDR